MRWILPLLLAACASSETSKREPMATEAPAAPATEAVPELTVAAALTSAPVEIDPQIAGDVEAAIELWVRATDGAYSPAGLRFTYGHIADCSTFGASGCYYPDRHEIRLSVKVQDNHRVSVLAHEIGHCLGLEHTDGGLMDPNRASVDPCVSADDVAGAGLEGPGACLVAP